MIGACATVGAFVITYSEFTYQSLPLPTVPTIVMVTVVNVTGGFVPEPDSLVADNTDVIVTFVSHW